MGQDRGAGQHTFPTVLNRFHKPKGLRRSDLSVLKQNGKNSHKTVKLHERPPLEPVVEMVHAAF